MSPEIVDAIWENIEKRRYMRTDFVWDYLWEKYFTVEDNNLRSTMVDEGDLTIPDNTFYMLVLLSEGETL